MIFFFSERAKERRRESFANETGVNVKNTLSEGWNRLHAAHFEFADNMFGVHLEI